jgi:uncharacterized protein YdaU (DUF1376 family)
VNYWPRWISAIKKRTATLSLAEMGAYDRLLDHYYAEEKPLPGDLDECCRICAALSKEERAAVVKVLAKFFTLTERGHTNERADEEIKIALPKIEAAKANGAKGGRPKGSTKKPSGLSGGLPVDTQDEPASKHPHPHLVKPGFENGEVRDPPDPALEGHTPTPGGAACKAIKAAGIPDVNPSHPDLQRLLAAGVTPIELADAAAVLVLKGKASFAYLLKTVEGQRIDAAAKAAVPTAAPAKPPVTVPSDDYGKTQAMLAAAAEKKGTLPPADLLARRRRTVEEPTA